MTTGARVLQRTGLAEIQAKHAAEKAYAAIRNSSDDVARIAKATGRTEAEIAQIKNHLFSDRHQLPGRVRRFDADPQIAAAWGRLQAGRQTAQDLALLEHELAESMLMKAGMSQRAAHAAAPALQGTSAGQGVSRIGTAAEKIADRTMSRAEWKGSARAYRAERAQAESWTKARSDQWKEIADKELSLPSSERRFSMANLQRMASGRAARIRVVMRSRKDPTKVVVRSVPLEFNHRYLPQRLGSGVAHEAWNLDMMTRWGHESVDRFRHAGWDLIKIIEGPNSLK